MRSAPVYHAPVRPAPVYTAPVRQVASVSSVNRVNSVNRANVRNVSNVKNVQNVRNIQNVRTQQQVVTQQRVAVAQPVVIPAPRPVPVPVPTPRPVPVPVPTPRPLPTPVPLPVPAPVGHAPQCKIAAPSAVRPASNALIHWAVTKNTARVTLTSNCGIVSGDMTAKTLFQNPKFSASERVYFAGGYSACTFTLTVSSATGQSSSCSASVAIAQSTPAPVYYQNTPSTPVYVPTVVYPATPVTPVTPAPTVQYTAPIGPRITESTVVTNPAGYRLEKQVSLVNVPYTGASEVGYVITLIAMLLGIGFAGYVYREQFMEAFGDVLSFAGAGNTTVPEAVILHEEIIEPEEVVEDVREQVPAKTKDSLKLVDGKLVFTRK